MTSLSILIIGGSQIAVAARGESLDAVAIGKAAGAEAKTGPDGVVRIGWSRTDVAVIVDGARLNPAAGLGSWAAFKPAPRNPVLRLRFLAHRVMASPPRAE